MSARHSASAILAATLVSGGGALWGAQPIGCLIEPDAAVEVGSPVIGVIQSVLVERGDRVARGQLLAVLRNDVERAALEAARTRSRVSAEERSAVANHEFARQRQVRAEDLYRKQFISKQALDQAITETEMAGQRVAQAREQQSALANDLGVAKARVEERNIRSPIDGVVTERYLSAGERVEEKPLLRIAKINPLRVEVIMPGSLFGTVAPGTSWRIVPDMPNAMPLEAKVVLVDKVLDAPSNTFRVRLRLPNPEAAIPAGVRCKAESGPVPGAPRVTPSAAPGAPPAAPALLKLDRELALPRPRTEPRM